MTQWSPVKGANLLVDPRAQQRKERREQRYPAPPVPPVEPPQKYDFSKRFRKPHATRGGADFGRSSAPRNYFKYGPRPERVDAKPMTAKDFAKMKHVEFKKHLAISRDGVDGSTPLACRRGLLPKTMGSGRHQTKVDRSKCKTGAEMRRGRPARPPSDTFEWCGVKFKVKRPPVEAVPEAAPRDPRPGTAAREAAADITAAVVDDLGGAAPAPAPLTPWEESLVGDAFKAPEGSRFKDRDLLAGVDVYAHMRDHAARGRPVSTITGRLQPYRGEATGRPPKFVPLEVGKARR